MALARTPVAIATSVATTLALIGIVIATGAWLSPPGDRAERAATWQIIEYDGVRVEIPATWERTDTSGCEFEIPRWGDPGGAPCEFEDGVTFYASATFDPAHGPGLVRDASDGTPRWSGYTVAGDLTVYVFDNRDRAVVRHILASVRTHT